MKKLLLLGGSRQQVVAIETARRLGVSTVLCDYLPDNPGQFVADKYYGISTTDVEAVYEVARKERVDGILPYASDPAALPAAIVCERLGLPTNPARSVEILGVKHKFREFLKQNGFACPKAFSFTVGALTGTEIKKAIDGFCIPLMVKPTDSSGSKGVTLLEDLGSLEDAIALAASYSRNKVLIIEEYIERGFPNVIGGDIFVSEGRIILLGTMECLRGQGGKGLIPIGKKLPASISETQKEKIHSELQKLISRLDINFGELNLELILDKADNVHFLELGPRAGGNMIPIQLSDAFEIDLVRANILAALGDDPKLAPFKPKSRYLTHVLHSYKDGCFDGIHIDASIEPYLYRKVLYKKHGDKVEAFDGAGKACGILFFHFPEESDINIIAENMEELVGVSLK